MSTMKLSRREEREQAFLFLFEKSFHEEPMSEMLQDALEARDEVACDFAQKLIAGVEEHREEIDEAILINAVGWKMKRISKVSLAVLRLAVYEIFYEEEIPGGVSINEAVELAKKFATDEDAAFINGILGSVFKAHEKREAPKQ